MPWLMEAAQLPTAPDELDRLAIIFDREAMLADSCVVIADRGVEHAAREALQTVVERMRATNPNTITAGTQTIGSFAVKWAVTDSSTMSRTVRVITVGPGLRNDTANVVPSLGANVADTFNLVLLKP